jgi:FlaA1/EpsC-like NDP-sugar epimerase
MLLPAVYYVAFWLRFEGDIPPLYGRKYATTVMAVVLIKAFAFHRFRVFDGWNRFLTFNDLLRIVEATLASSIGIAVWEYLTGASLAIPRSVVILDWAGSLVVAGVIRAWDRLREELPGLCPWLKEQYPVLIVGTNGSGEALLRNLRCSTLPYQVIGFLATDPAAVGRHIGGVSVLGTVGNLAIIAAGRRLREVLVTSGELSGKQLRELVEICRGLELNVKVLPSIEQLVAGKVDLKPRRVSIEDLLRREAIILDQEGLRNWLQGCDVMVTGSAGSIGSEICRQLLQFDPGRMLLVDRWENGQFCLEQELKRIAPSAKLEICLADVSDQERMDAVFREHRPRIVFHAAAYKHVPLMETHPGEAIRNIVGLTKTLADLAIEHQVQSFVMISTDKAVNPTSVMGACKRVAELYCQSLSIESGCQFVTVRFGNVLDSSGSVVPTFREQINRGGPVTVTHPDMRRYFMTIPEASQLVIQAGAIGQGGEILVLDMGQPVRIVDLAEDMIRLSGFIPGEDIEIEFTGLRPGEKLFEELLVDGECHLPTSHPKIHFARCQVQSRLEIARTVKRLLNLIHAPRNFILEELCRAVPEFQHESSRTVVPHGRRAAA